MIRPLSIAILASSEYPIIEPFAGGLEAHVWTLTRALRARGHRVTLFAAPGSDPTLGVETFAVSRVVLSRHARNDVSMPPDMVIRDHHAYLTVMTDLGAATPGRFDLVHNHSLHYLPLTMASTLSIPVVSTLHTPPTPWLESAVQIVQAGSVRFVSVSAFTAQSWLPSTGPVAVIPNGIDTDRWQCGPGGEDLIWFGRVVPEKAPHLAILAALRAGRSIDLAGPIVDRDYYAERVRPLLGPSVRYLGHLSQPELSDAVRHAAAAVVTPEWDEPYGLVVAEALSSGTPVAAFDRGGICETVTPDCARLVAGGDVAALAGVLDEASRLDRQAARRRAEDHCSITTMVEAYERLFAEVVGVAA